jgi:hypothetical protein
MFMTTPGFVILLLMGLLLFYLYIELAQIPGKKAKERGHPQADAINILGWIGPFLGIAGWAVALVWAYYRPAAAMAPAALPERAGPEREGPESDAKDGGE